jgi:phosphoglycerate kinase
LSLRTLSDAPDLTGQVVLLRVDANVPLRDGVITDDGRIRAFIPTLDALRRAGAVIYVLSHLGRPETPGDPQLSLAPVADRLRTLAGGDVRFVPHVSGSQAFAGARDFAPGTVVVLENVRFDARETSRDATLRAELAG